MSPRLASLLLVVPALGALAGCGKDAGSSSSKAACVAAANGRFTLIAKNIKWSTDCITVARPGRLQITLRSEDQAAHNVHVTGQGVDRKTPLQGGPMVQHLTVDLPSSGTYTYICDLHEFTMKGTLKVG
ncbi:MAG: hypothetical protein JWM05_1816 [Acidimicrobiales bacterium]|nr:hypothetical protein [Acidimicrobiales bacterium]